MDERLQNILNCGLKAARQAGASVSDALDAAGDKAGRLVTAGQLNCRIAELNAQIRAGLQRIGEMIYATHTGDPTSSDDLLVALRDIDRLNEQIRCLQAQVNQLLERSACPKCGAAAQPEDLYCRECGAKL